jgi:hypothetical protein
MNRREFLIRTGGLLVALPAASALAQGPGAGHDLPRLLVYRSTVTGDHDHTVSIGRWALERPPAIGVSGMTSISGHHQHEVRLSHDDLAQLLAGKTVIRQTTTVVGHHHEFLFKLPGA